jgi:hypothetical protein
MNYHWLEQLEAREAPRSEKFQTGSLGTTAGSEGRPVYTRCPADVDLRAAGRALGAGLAILEQHRLLASLVGLVRLAINGLSVIYLGSAS